MIADGRLAVGPMLDKRFTCVSEEQCYIKRGENAGKVFVCLFNDPPAQKANIGY